MIIEFQQEYLREIYEENKASGKKYRFQPQVIRQYRKTVNRLRDAKTTEELFTIKSLNYEKLAGGKAGFESVRVNDQYRIEFISRTEGQVPDIITICSITALSNHYK